MMRTTQKVNLLLLLCGSYSLLASVCADKNSQLRRRIGTKTASFQQPLHQANSAIRCTRTENSQKKTVGRTTTIASTTSLSDNNPCVENNSSYISWPIIGEGSPQAAKHEKEYDLQLRQDAEKEMLHYLYSNLMPFDIPNAETLGFHTENLPDGLSNGIVEPTISIAIDTKSYPWTSHVPKEIYFEYIVNFANVNEARSNWRSLFHVVLTPIRETLVSKTASVEEVVRTINKGLWDLFPTGTGKPITFKSGQTPLIYDPMSIIAFGYASCTGVTIFLVNALRTMGIPARLAGTDAWNGKVENGNHSWIEFYGADGQWHIMESLPASGGDGDGDIFDPCQWWFCNEDRVKDTKFWAARLDRLDSDDVHFPMSWDLDNDGVPGVDRTDFMRDLCSKC